MNIFIVYVRANVWAGKYYDYRAAPIKVIAESAEEAIEIISKYPAKVAEHLKSIKVRAGNGFRYLIPHRQPALKNVFIDENRKPFSAKIFKVTGASVKALNNVADTVNISVNNGIV